MIGLGCKWSSIHSFSTNHFWTVNLSNWYTPRTYLDSFRRVCRCKQSIRKVWRAVGSCRSASYATRSSYRRESPGAQSMHHIRGLRSLYDKASRAKQAYHSLVTGHLHEQLLVASMKHRLNSLHQTTETMHHTAKHVVTTLYYGSTTVVCLARCYRQHIHRSQELYRTRQCYTQSTLNHTMDWFTQAHQTKRTLYDTATRPIHQQLYLQRKRPREELAIGCGAQKVSSFIGGFHGALVWVEAALDRIMGWDGLEVLCETDAEVRSGHWGSQGRLWL